jgi:hypothetical protein
MDVDQAELRFTLSALALFSSPGFVVLAFLCLLLEAYSLLLCCLYSFEEVFFTLDIRMLKSP